MKRKIFIKLIGGLGNQLFQYACAKNLALNLKGSLFIDDKTGFYLDKKFKRKKALPNNLNYKQINLIDLILFYTLLGIKKIFYKRQFYYSFGRQIIIDETNEKEFIKDFFKITKNYDKIFLNGFFQTEKYFEHNKEHIVKEIIKSKINNKIINKIKNKISKNSVCVGIRMYEEAPQKIKYNFGGIENYSFYNNSINYFKKKNSKLKFFIFSTFKNKKYIKNKIKENVEIINENYDKNDDLNFLLLFSYFKNFIISNSSYYWWGAYLAGYKKKINVVASKKFTNINTVLNYWK